MKTLNVNKNKQCPFCKSFKTVSGGMMAFATGMANAGCVGFALMIIIPPIGLLVITMGLVLMLLSPFMNRGQFYCQDCKQKFQM